MTESNSQDNGIVAVENVKSSDIPDNAALSTDLYVHGHIVCCFIIRLFLVCNTLSFYLYTWTRSKDAGSPSIVGDIPVLVGDSEMEQHVGELELNNDAPSESWNWNEEDIDAPSSEFVIYVMYMYIYVCLCVYNGFMFNNQMFEVI